MRILQIAPPWIDVPPKEYGGTEQVVYNLASGLQELGHHVTVYATQQSRVPATLMYTYTQGLVDRGLAWEAALPALAHYHQAFKVAPAFDFVHAHLSSQTDIMTLPFLADLAQRHIPAALTIHGHTPYDRFSKTDSTYLRLYGRQIYVINISKAMMPFTPPQFKKVGFIHNSLDPLTIRFNLNKGRYLTWLGKIVPDKNVSEAILTAKASGIPMVFGGVVDKHNPHSVAYFETMVKPLIDGKDVVYVGPVKAKDKSQLLGQAMGFLYPMAWDEPFGMVLVEAMAAGTPVIAYKKGAAPELIDHGKTGFLVRNRTEMLQAITRLSTISRLACRSHVETNFNPVNAAKKHVAIYAKVMNKYATLTAEAAVTDPYISINEALNYMFRSISPTKR